VAAVPVGGGHRDGVGKRVRQFLVLS
jgi:hypothetical protein